MEMSYWMLSSMGWRCLIGWHHPWDEDVLLGGMIHGMEMSVKGDTISYGLQKLKKHGNVINDLRTYFEGSFKHHFCTCDTFM